MSDSAKYPRTFHFEISPGKSSDDKVLYDLSGLINQDLIFTEKVDGSNFCLERSGCFARTHSGPPTHSSFDQAKALHAQVKHLIPPSIQIFGEWCYAVHSIVYEALPSYFLCFGVRDSIRGEWADWNEVERWAEELNVPTVPVLYSGRCDSEENIDKLTRALTMSGIKSVYGGAREGVVCRIAHSFSDQDFTNSVVKYVRSNHVTSDQHWRDKEIVRQRLIV